MLHVQNSINKGTPSIDRWGLASRQSKITKRFEFCNSRLKNLKKACEKVQEQNFFVAFECCNGLGLAKK